MTRSLEQICSFLERLNRREVLARLRPGLDPEEIRSRLARVGLDTPADLEDLYSWRNGTRVEAGSDLDSVQFFPGFYLLSLDDALENYEGFRRDSRWDSAWLPVFANGGGDFYAVNTAEGSGPIIGFIIDQSEHPVEYEGLGAMLETLADCFTEGVCFVDDRGYLEMDDRRHAAIARRHNANLTLWSGQ